MQVTLSPHGEELLKAQLARHAGSSPEQIVERALEKLAEQRRHRRSATRRPPKPLPMFSNCAKASLSAA